jgi:hypothetical protein
MAVASFSALGVLVTTRGIGEECAMVGAVAVAVSVAVTVAMPVMVIAAESASSVGVTSKGVLMAQGWPAFAWTWTRSVSSLPAPSIPELAPGHQPQEPNLFQPQRHDPPLAITRLERFHIAFCLKYNLLFKDIISFPKCNLLYPYKTQVKRK